MDRVLIVTSADFPYGGPSANFVRNFVTGMALSLDEVEILLQKGNYYEDSANCVLPKNVIYKHSAFSKRPDSILGMFLDTVAGLMIPFLRILFSTKSYKIVFLYNGTAYGCLPALIASKIRRIPVSNIVAEWYEPTFFKNVLRKKDFGFRMKVLNLRFDYLVVLSHFLLDYYVSKGFSRDKLILIPNLVDISTFQNNIQVCSLAKKESTELDIVVLQPEKTESMIYLLPFPF